MDAAGSGRAPIVGSWSSRDTPGQTGRVALVTGANSGLGLVTATELARAGAHVVLACRNPERGRQAVEQVRSSGGSGTAELAVIDLADLDSVATAAESLLARLDGLDVLVANAGVMATPQARTAQGYELQMGTNHLGHFALVGRLLPLLLARPGSRVVSVSSLVHWMARLDPADPLGETSRYNPWTAYARSKLANLLFTAELSRRAEAAGAELLALTVHPGYAATNLQSTGPKLAGSRWSERLLGLGNTVFAQSAASGALPSLYAATMPGLVSDDFLGPNRWLGSRGHPGRAARSPAARNAHHAAALWRASAAATGVDYRW